MSGSDATQPRLGLFGWLRFGWRQLTSMRTALFLLLLLAVAAVPGSVLPQRRIDASKVSGYLREHQTSGRWIERLGGFDVYTSVWFSAIYLLLFVSLVGCVLPRSRQHLRAIRTPLPRMPARLERLPAHRTLLVDQDPQQALAALAQGLRRRRFRVSLQPDTISAERGRLRETGNLVFHLALVVLLVAIAIGHLFGWRGDVVVPVGETFSNSADGAYDALDTGPWVDDAGLPPFSLHIDSMSVRFERGAEQRGAPRDFRAKVTARPEPGAGTSSGVIAVNHPLHIAGAKVYLLGNGYAPVITVRDSTGQVAYSQPTPFLPQDGTYTSTGVVKAPGARPRDLGVIAQFLPTASTSGGMPRSIFPDALNPVLALTALEGDLGLGSGRPESVYALDVRKMTSLKTASGEVFRAALRPGETVKLPGGRGSITFDRLERFAGLSIRHDPGKGWALGASVAAMLGLALSLFVPRRRLFVRIRPSTDPADDGRTLVEVGALARGTDTGLNEEIERALAVLGPAEPRPSVDRMPVPRRDA